MSPYLETAYNEGLKAGVLKLQPELSAAEMMIGALEKKITGHIAVTMNLRAQNKALTIQVDVLKRQRTGLIIGLCIGVPVVIGAGILIGLLL